MPFPTRVEYERLVYHLPETYPDVIAASTLRFYSTSALTGKLEGVVQFVNGLQLRMKEVIDFRLGRIVDYSYTVLRGEERVRWYDPQPHPELGDLAATFPHHRHEPPDLKHNRRPAPGISFLAPNLPVLITDCVELGRGESSTD
ncbi:MAG: hypothetical protein HY259_05500 [Chloroflexi bacterium]|nr:hypothetical protein [Chloroflexota bacterium]MBI3732897.1 hypothetical protein [Chloroflexota bacterium]